MAKVALVAPRILTALASSSEDVGEYIHDGVVQTFDDLDKVSTYRYDYLTGEPLTSMLHSRLCTLFHPVQ